MLWCACEVVDISVQVAVGGMEREVSRRMAVQGYLETFVTEFTCVLIVLRTQFLREYLLYQILALADVTCEPHRAVHPDGRCR